MTDHLIDLHSCICGPQRASFDIETIPDLLITSLGVKGKDETLFMFRSLGDQSSIHSTIMYASSSKDSRPPLSIRTTRTDRSNSSPTKSLPLPLYSLPPLVDTPTSSRPKARPGGLAAQDVDVSRSRRRSSELALPRRQPSPPRDPGPDQAVSESLCHH